MDTGGPTARANPDVDSNFCAIACISCGQRGAKHPATVAHTAVENSSDDTSYADAI